jgi:hypothetical protein
VSELSDLIAAKRAQLVDVLGANAAFRGVAPLSRVETWYAQTFLDPAPDLERIAREYRDVPVPGVVVGMAPGLRTSASLPMFPHPAGSAGGRLLAMSGMPVEAYFGRLRRANLCRGVFRVAEARERARELYLIYRTVYSPHPRFVLCGRQVASAFYDVLREHGGADIPWFERREWAGIGYVAVPHPSGRCREYSDPANVARTRDAVRWAARYEESEER